MNATTKVITYHVRYKPAGLDAASDEWWDWKKMDTPEEAIAQFTSYPPRVQNSREVHVVETVTITKETRLKNL